MVSNVGGYLTLWQKTDIAFVPGPVVPMFVPEQKNAGIGTYTHCPSSQGLVSH